MLPFIIQSIFHIVSAVSIAALILFGNFGILGAGGKSGNSISTFGRNDGSSGKSGGPGIVGTLGMFTDRLKSSNCIFRFSIKFIPIDKDCLASNDISILGASGMFGKLGRFTLVGTKLNSGSFISIHIFKSEKSRYILGIFIGGISNTGSI